MRGGAGFGVDEAKEKAEKQARDVQQALRNIFDEIDEDGGGTLDLEEVGECFEKMKIEVTDDELLELLIAANYPSGGGLAVGDPNWREEATEFEITFDQFALWMISSSSLADRLRTILGGPLEQAFSIDAMGIEEREQYDGWLYMFPGSPRCTMFVLLEEPESSKAAKLVSTYVLLLILYSSTTFVVETLQAVQNSPSTLRFLGHSETFCILHFTVEYVGRAFTCTARPYSQNGFLPYVTAPENLVDIVSILPFYIEIFFGGEVGLSVLRVLRMARIFRVFKVGSYAKNLSVVKDALVRSGTGLSLLVYLVTIFVVVMSSVIYTVENDPGAEEPTPGFESIPNVFWFTCVTMTSVGYGDVYPNTDLGKFLGMIVMLCGILTLAIPITLIGNKFNEVWQETLMLEREKEKRHQLRESHIQHDSDDPSNSVDYEQINREKTDAYKRTLCMLLEDACKATQETTFELCKAVLLANANDSDVQMSADFRYALAAEAARLSNLAQSGLQSLTREESDALFAKLDANSDGQLSYREIRKGLSNIKESTGLVQTAQQILSGADVDNDSRVDAAEFYFYLQRETLSHTQQNTGQSEQPRAPSPVLLPAVIDEDEDARDGDET